MITRTTHSMPTRNTRNRLSFGILAGSCHTKMALIGRYW